MRIAVTGSIATDHLMTFPGRFIEQLMPGKHDKIALSFLVDSLEIRRGGVAANMAFGLGCLGLRPLLVGTAGSDFGEYRDWLDRHGVDTSGVRESARHHTARFIGTTDADMNQIGSFYPGAMTEDRDIDLAELAGQVDLVLIGASDPDAMLAFTKQCIQNQIAFAADTSWQLARLDGEQVRSLITGADYLFCNEYEASLTEHKTGWSAADLSDRVGVRVTTLGSRGARVDRARAPAGARAGRAGSNAEGADRSRRRLPGRFPGRRVVGPERGAGGSARQHRRRTCPRDHGHAGVQARTLGADRAVLRRLRQPGRRGGRTALHLTAPPVDMIMITIMINEPGPLAPWRPLRDPARRRTRRCG